MQTITKNMYQYDVKRDLISCNNFAIKEENTGRSKNEYTFENLIIHGIIR